VDGVGGVGYDALAEVVLALGDEVDDASDGVSSEESFLVEVDDPVVVAEHVDVVLEAVLERPGLVEGAGLGPVGGGHYRLQHAVVPLQVYSVVCDHLNYKII